MSANINAMVGEIMDAAEKSGIKVHSASLCFVEYGSHLSFISGGWRAGVIIDEKYDQIHGRGETPEKARDDFLAKIANHPAPEQVDIDAAHAALANLAKHDNLPEHLRHTIGAAYSELASLATEGE